MFWSKNDPQSQEQQNESFQLNEPPILNEEDFSKIIDLQEKYNYFKSLVKIQQLNEINEYKNQKNMMKILTELIQYYALCITEAERNVENIVKFFQHKMKDLNAHFIKVFTKQKNVESENSKRMFQKSENKVKELGHIQSNFQKLRIPEPCLENYKEENMTQRPNDIKKKLNKTLMIALQNQNIDDHFNQTNKKAEFLRRSIAIALEEQETMLQKRRKEGKKKKENGSKQVKLSIANTLETASSNYQRNILRKDFPNFDGGYNSSDSDLDEAQSLYIQNFTLEQIPSSPSAQSIQSKSSPLI